MSVPTQDRIWWRFRHEQVLLAQLLSFDLALVRSSEQLYLYVAQLSPEIWNIQGSTQVSNQIQPVVQIAHNRERFLLLQM